jgi:hypothetical protein
MLDLPERYRGLSSSQVRSEIHGQGPGTGVPPIVQSFSATTGAYQPPVATAGGRLVDRYAIREQLIEAGCVGKLGAPTPSELHAQWLAAIASDSGVPEDH